MPAEQPDLTGKVHTDQYVHPNNLPSDLVDRDGIVQIHQWLHYARQGTSIGDCRACGRPLYTERPMPVNASRTDYIAACTGATGCGKEVVFPNGRTGRWDATLTRGKKRKLPQGMVGIAKNAAGIGQSREDGDD